MRPASRLSQLATVLALAGLAAVVVMASRLQPSERGFGTHQQLGLPPCSSILWLGQKCPACGMTTAWSHAVRGQFAQAWQANAGGTLLLFIALAYTVPFCYYLTRGHWSRHGWLSFSLALSLAAAMAVAFGQWMWRVIDAA